MNLYEKARLFATAAHAACGQIRKYTGEPYIVHPIEVADLLTEYCRAVDVSNEMLAAACLHDVLEDTKVEYELLRAEFGIEVADMVLWLTDVSTSADGNRSTRKEIDRARIALAPADVQTVKVADLISNTRSILAHDLNFARVYIREKELLLGVLIRADAGIKAAAEEQVRQARKVFSEFDSLKLKADHD